MADDNKIISGKWSEDELNYLREFYPDNGAEFCAAHLNRGKRCVNGKTNKIGLIVNSDTVSRILKSAQHKYQDNRSNEDFGVNIDQFLNIETKEVAYLLGFWWADAYIHFKRGEIRFEMADADMVDIKQIMDSIGKWKYYNRKLPSGKVLMTRAVTNNKRLCDLLAEYDYNKKSRVSADKIISKIPNELKNYFFRDLVDGDGCIWANEILNGVRISICSSYDYDWNFLNMLSSQLNINSHVFRAVSKNGSSSYIAFNGMNAKIFGDFIYFGYSDDKIGLVRKYEKYLKLIEIMENRSKSNNSKLNIRSLIVNMYLNGFTYSDMTKKYNIPNTTCRRWVKDYLIKKEGV